jgi:hypothetical protein
MPEDPNIMILLHFFLYIQFHVVQFSGLQYCDSHSHIALSDCLFIAGNFSFGSSTKFKSHTIVDFIENAVEHSRSGRYLFFLHRRPVLGPMRVQLLHPVSRFKQVQSLQHMCR